MTSRIFLLFFLLTFTCSCASYKSIFTGKKPNKKTYQTQKSSGKSNHAKQKKYSKFNKAKIIRGYFDWPIQGNVTSTFGPRWGRMHQGIDIGVESGSKVKASASGKVVFADEMGGYGKLVLIEHKDNYFTAYAHNSKIKVKEGTKVKKGSIVALSGNTGSSTGPHVHFEIRKGSSPQNPLAYLP